MTERSRLPPLHALQALESAVRLGSFTRAAGELHLTPGAVTRQIQQLSHWTGERLFTRRGRDMVPTPEGLALLSRLAGPLGDLHRAMRGDDDAQVPLRIATLGSIARHWLLPRLPRFLAQAPGRQVRIETDYALVRPAPGDALVALRFGPVAASGRVLFRDALIAVATPTVAARMGPEATRWRPADLIAHEGTGAEAWWADAGAHDPGAALVFNDAGLALDTVLAGSGVGILRLSLALDALEDGRLRPAHRTVTATARANQLVVTPAALQRPIVRDVVAWLTDEAASTEVRLRAWLARPADPD